MSHSLSVSIIDQRRCVCLLSVDDLALCLYPPLDYDGVETSVRYASLVLPTFFDKFLQDSFRSTLFCLICGGFSPFAARPGAAAGHCLTSECDKKCVGMIKTAIRDKKQASSTISTCFQFNKVAP